jgi:hypothetical protein
VSRDGPIHQTQDQGIEAVRPGAGRNGYECASRDLVDHNASSEYFPHL